ncbi:MAG: right-handed parallel beta-helix repeat-containing protein [Methanomassiliicoccus sp.]|nr:right-handed parallel beta-helix repeat-containing protein [Methanomassiliicoccus sp.]
MVKVFNKLGRKLKYLVVVVAIVAMVISVAVMVPLTSGSTDPTVFGKQRKVSSSITISIDSSTQTVGKNVHADCILKAGSGITYAKVSIKVIQPNGLTAYPTQGSSTTTGSNGKFSMDYTPKMTGTHKFVATFNGNSYYSSATDTESFIVKSSTSSQGTVAKSSSTIDLTVSSSTVYTGATIHAYGQLSSASVISNGAVQLKVTLPNGGTAYPVQGSSVSADSNGSFTADYVPTTTGTFTLTATFAGDSTHSGSSANVSFVATAQPSATTDPTTNTTTGTTDTTTNTTTGANSTVASSYKYIVTNVGGTYYAKNAVTGATISSGTNAATVIQAALNSLTSGRTVKEGVLLQGSFTLTSAITIPSYTTLKLEGTVTATSSNHMLTANGQANQPKAYFDIVGGEWNGNGKSSIPFYFRYCSDVSVSGLKVHDSPSDLIEFISCSRITVSNVESYNGVGSCCGLVYSNNCVVENNNFHDGGSGIYCYAEDDGIVQDISDMIIRGNTVARTQASGIEAPSLRGLEDIGDNYLIENNLCIDCGMDGDHPGIMVGWGGFGSVQIRFATNAIVRNNEIYTTGAYACDQGIDFKCNSGGKVYGNYIHDAYTVGMIIRGVGNEVYSNTITGGRTSAPGVELWDASSTYFHDNVLTGLKGTGIWIVVSDGSKVGCNNNVIDHNTINGVSGEWVSISDSISTGNVIQNNTFYKKGSIANAGTGTVILNNTII